LADATRIDATKAHANKARHHAVAVINEVEVIRDRFALDPSLPTRTVPKVVHRDRAIPRRVAAEATGTEVLEGMQEYGSARWLAAAELLRGVPRLELALAGAFAPGGAYCEACGVRKPVDGPHFVQPAPQRAC